MKRKKHQDGGSNWMDTYGDMVTLLLCFFVLLYSISSVDQEKWIILVKSLNPNAEEVSQIAIDPNSEGTEEVPGSFEAAEVTLSGDAFDALYQRLKEAVEQGGLADSIELYKGEDFTMVTFRDRVFFDGNSSVIKEEGKEILNLFTSILSDANDVIQEIQVLGHTSQELPDVPNHPETDRVLSGERSARVAAYIQENTVIDPEKLISLGYGQWHPVAPFDTTENRAKNRRVELLIKKQGSVSGNLEEYYTEMNQ